MLRLTETQETTLCEFIARGEQTCSIRSPELERTLSWIMKSIDVRKIDQITDQRVRMLVDAAFALIKARHYLDNGILSPLQYDDHVEELKTAVAAHYPGAGLNVRRDPASVSAWRL